MLDDKLISVCQAIHDADSSELNFELILKMKKAFNEYCESIGLSWKIKKSFSIVEQSEGQPEQEAKSHTMISDVFFYPLHKIVQLDGSDIGLRIGAIKRTDDKNIYKYFEFDIARETLRDASWLESKYIKKMLKVAVLKEHYNRYYSILQEIEPLLLKNRNKVVLTDRMGWLEGATKWHFVPITSGYQTELIYHKKLSSKYNIKIDEELTKQEAFIKTLKMLDITDKRITFPLLSFAIVSLFTSHIEYIAPNMSKFFINLFGGYDKQVRVHLANLFCNFFDRRVNINSLNENYHSNLNCTEEDLKNKATPIRDSIFVINIDENSRKVSMAKKLLQRDDFESMILLLNNEAIEQDFVLNVNLEGANINSDQFSLSKNEPAALTRCISDLIHYYSRAFSLEGSSKKRVHKLFLNMYKENRELLDNKGLNTDINRVHYYSCLLIGLKFFLQYGMKIGAIEVEGSKDYLAEAVALFKEQCSIEPEDKHDGNPQKEIHIIFLEKLLSLLLVNELPALKDKNNASIDNTNNLGWQDELDILYVRSAIFKKIDDLVDQYALKFSNQKNKLTIYKSLYDVGIILPPDSNKIDKIQITTIEKSLNVASKAKTAKVFLLDKKRAIELMGNKKVQG